MTKRAPEELDFSRKYNSDHSLQYLKKHHETLERRLSHYRDEQMLRRALKTADNPTLVLDLPNANQNRFVANREVIESEFKEAGFTIIGRQDFLPGYAMWRVYKLHKDSL